jgi:hypothetical protein
VLAEAKSAEKMNNASIQRLSWGPNSSENNGQELKNKSHFMALSHGFCGGGGIMTENHCLGHPVLRQNHIVDVAQTEGCHFIIQFV